MNPASITVSPENKSFGLFDFLLNPTIDTVTTALLEARLLQEKEGLAKVISTPSDRIDGQIRGT